MDVDVYHSYTLALRHPVIIGHVAGWRLPWALSVSQLGAIAAMSGLLLVSRPLWAHLGGIGNLAVFTLMVAASGWAVRHWRIESRSPFWVAAALATVVLSPACRRGVRNGRPVASQRLIRGARTGVPITTVPPLIGSRNCG